MWLIFAGFDSRVTLPRFCWHRVSDILSNMSKKKRKCLKASVHGFTGIFTLQLKVTVLERMKSETLVIIIIIISQSWVLCSSCWGSSSGSWTWSMVSVDCRHYAPDPPLKDKHSETQHLKLYSLHVTLYMCVILTETQEECVHAHVIHAEEAVSDQIRTEHHRLSHTHTHTL